MASNSPQHVHPLDAQGDEIYPACPEDTSKRTNDTTFTTVDGKSLELSSQLNIPQLKAICKARGLSKYAHANKPALLQMLGIAAPEARPKTNQSNPRKEDHSGKFQASQPLNHIEDEGSTQNRDLSSNNLGATCSGPPTSASDIVRVPEQFSESSTVVQLRALCKARGLSGVSKASKSKLLQLLRSSDNDVAQSHTTTQHGPTPDIQAASPLALRTETQTPVQTSITDCESHTQSTYAPPVSADSADGQVFLGNAEIPADTAINRDSLTSATIHASLPGFPIARPKRKNLELDDKLAKKNKRAIIVQQDPSANRTKPPSLLTAQQHHNDPRALLDTSDSSIHEMFRPQCPSEKSPQQSPPTSPGEDCTAPLMPLNSLSAAQKPSNRSASNSHASTKPTKRPQKTFKPLRPVGHKKQPELPPKPNVSRPPLPELPLVAFRPIKHPPSLAQRRSLPGLAIILSGLGDAERRRVSRVSRTWRYAVYLSAIPILNHKFPGARLQQVYKQYSPEMINFWPYLRRRQAEATRNLLIFEGILHPRTFERSPIHPKLWKELNCEGQAMMAIRFILTRLWMKFEVGVNLCNNQVAASVVDVQQVVSGELWRVLLSDQTSLIALDGTGEVVGGEGTGAGLRSDWASFIATVSQKGLFERLRWTNGEEYHHGISKLWMKRAGHEELAVAQRYVVACVAGNGVSGKWMSCTEMAAELACLPTDTQPCRIPVVNLFLPAHHLVESVHFKTSSGAPLHPALAAVQTPGREYFVLRANGCPVGCEEDGIRKVWQVLIDCAADGVANS